jgi:hypothetical protein
LCTAVCMLKKHWADQVDLKRCSLRWHRRTT